MMPMVDPMPMRSNKYVVTVKSGKDLRCDNVSSSKHLNPFCELSLADQGPFHTGIKIATANPTWDDSVEFREPDPGMPSTLKIICYTRGSSIRSPRSCAPVSDADNGSNKKESGLKSKGCSSSKADEIGHAELRLSALAPWSDEPVQLSLFRKNPDGSNEPAGSLILDITHVLGVEEDRVVSRWPSEDDRVCDLRVPSLSTESDRLNEHVRGARRPIRARVPVVTRLAQTVKEQPPRVKWTALGALGAVIFSMAVGILMCRTSELPELPRVVPIKVPFNLSVHKYKGSETHHVRLDDDGNVVVAYGSRPCDVKAAINSECDPGEVLWQSGPSKHIDQEQGCKRCQLKVDKTGRMVLWQGKQELQEFSSMDTNSDRGGMLARRLSLFIPDPAPLPVIFANKETIKKLK